MSKKIDNNEHIENTEVVETVEEAAEVNGECTEAAVEEKKEEKKENAFLRFICDRETEEKGVSIGDWLIVRAIRCLPFIQLIPYLIWAFGNYPKSKKNWARAELIWIALRIIIIVAIVLIIKAIFS